MSTLYRVLTEDKPNLAELTSKYFDAFTLLHGEGYWQGTKEHSAVIEVSGDSIESKIQLLAREINAVNSQQAVLIERLPYTAELVLSSTDLLAVA